MLASRRASLVIPVLLALTACDRPPASLVAGTDSCEFCRMTVSDVRFGAQLQSRTGKVYAFDAIECLASFVLDASARDDVRLVRVTDFDSSELIPVDSAQFLQGSSIASPMGRSLVAFGRRVDRAAVQARFGGRWVTWEEIVERLRVDGLAPGAGSRDRTDSVSAAPTAAATRGNHR